MDFIQYLLLGLATSLHCVAMCGTLVMAYSVKSEVAGGFAHRIVPHLAYQAAKVVSYMTVAVLLGSLAALAGTALDITGFRDWVMVLAGAFMVLLGLGMTDHFPWLRRLTPRPPESLARLLSRNRRRAMDDAAQGRVGIATPVTLGLLTGVMPCAPLIAAQAGAMTAASPFRGAVLMLGFGLGTAPLMLLLGLASGFLSAKFRRRMHSIAAIAVLLFGLVVLNRGLVLVGSPVTFETVKRAVVGSPGAGAGSVTDSRGVAEFDLVIEDTRFVPDTVSLPPDRPTRIIVDRREDDSCSDQLAIPQLGVLVDLEPFGKTTVELPPAKAGNYTLTCGMGMMSGSVVFGETAGSAGSPLVVGMSAAALLAVAGWAVFSARRSKGASEEIHKGEEAASGHSRTILGLSWAEALVIALAMIVAVVAGLYLGGQVRP